MWQPLPLDTQQDRPNDAHKQHKHSVPRPDPDTRLQTSSGDTRDGTGKSSPSVLIGGGSGLQQVTRQTGERGWTVNEPGGDQVLINAVTLENTDATT